MNKTNINLQPNYWNQIWTKEGTATWRRYPGCFGRICWAVGHLQEVLELGCGTGILASQLLEFGNVVTGLDISEVAITQLPEEIKGVVATLPEIPLADNSFDVVVATEVLEHIDDDQACVREAVRVLRPGGRAYFAVPNNCLGPDEEPEHVRKYTPETLEALLSPYGHLFMESFVDEFVISSNQIIAIPTILAAIYTSG
ncbi:MAG: class I SAM-dependent methyltransferase [Coleofasciculus sp. S288]|nr:class I SAM-dependent methyltransferase [Coleofasciculus sp. S288]